MDRKPAALTIHVLVDFGEATLAVLQALTHHHGGCNCLAEAIMRLQNLETHLKIQDEQIAAFKADADAKFAAFGSSLDTIAADQTNIAGDQAGLLAQIKLLQDNAGGELSPANLILLNGISTDFGALVVRAQATATALTAVADSVPDAPPPSTT